jgi:hypothetical protein
VWKTHSIKISWCVVFATQSEVALLKSEQGIQQAYSKVKDNFLIKPAANALSKDSAPLTRIIDNQ